MMELCRCHSRKLYKDCCKKFHDGEKPATAEQLMRSRYCAYAMGLADYIMKTTHVKNPRYQKDQEKWKNEILLFSRGTVFEDLAILDFVDGQKEAFVTFKATLKQGDQDASFTEKSRFLKEDGQWLYVNYEI